MVNYNITLTGAENKALSYVARDQQDWIDNAVHERCRIAIDEIVQIVVQKCLDTGTQIPGSKDAIVELGFDLGWVTPAAQRQPETSALEGDPA